MSKKTTIPNAGVVPSGTAADTGIDEQNADVALRKPLTDTSPGSDAYKLSGVLGATEPGGLPERPDYGPGTGFSTFPRFEGDTPASRKAFTAKARKVKRSSSSS